MSESLRFPLASSSPFAVPLVPLKGRVSAGISERKKDELLLQPSFVDTISLTRIQAYYGIFLPGYRYLKKMLLVWEKLPSSNHYS
jgi:hypothetical protein